MKKILLLFSALLFGAITFAQAPQRMSYQAVVRNGSNVLITNAAVGMRISILQGSPTGTAQYVETHSTTTNTNGLATLAIGTGTVVSGTMASINWAAGPFFIKTETDPAGGTNYTITGTSELMSTPYALYAANSAQGPQGPQGLTGATGPVGPAGATGAQGPQGVMGATGAVGATGAQGPQGTTGATGAVGPQGAQGSVGATGPAGTTGQAGSAVFGSGNLTVTSATGNTVIPGLTTTITVPTSCVVYLSSTGGIATTATTATGFSVVDVFFAVDGIIVANGGYQRVVAANTTGLNGVVSSWSLCQVLTLTAGSHIFSVRAAGVGIGADATVSGNNTSVNQGTLNVVMLKL